MAPKRGAPRRVKRTLVKDYAFYITTELTAGFAAIGPRGGFSSTNAPHFLKLRCLKCGDETEKDVCLYLLASDTPGCTRLHGPRVQEICFPKCPNDSHLVRKCSCGRLGSVEVTAPVPCDEEERGEEDPPVMIIRTIGYAPVSYVPSSGWVATTSTGRLLPISYTDGCDFRVMDETTSDNISAGTASFDFTLKA